MTRAALAGALGGYLPPGGARIGLLGGSFNPAHEGHRHISREALTRLGLDQVWWLVSPQNPLKSKDGMATLSERTASARAVARDRRIRVAEIESLLGVRYTADTVLSLKRHFPSVRFVWLMGGDSLRQIAAWRQWPRIFHGVVIAVFDRPTYSLSAMSSVAAYRFARYRVRERGARALLEHDPPAWIHLHGQLVARSATEIRTRRRREAIGGTRR